MTDCLLIGAPVESGTRQRGCLMGPDAFRTAGLHEALASLGHGVVDRGNLSLPAVRRQVAGPDHLYRLSDCAAWIEVLMPAARRAMGDGLPIFLGGDHLLAAGTVAGVAAHAADVGRPLFVLWLDAHSDFHSLHSTRSGNLHGTPLAYVTGQPGFEMFPALPAMVPPEQVCAIGLRSVDAEERALLARTAIDLQDMRAIDETGIAAPLKAFLARVRAARGLLHVSLDVDFLDPQIAPGVGTTVPGGATMREAHLVMELLHDSGLVSALDLVELNPFLDERGRTASLMVDLCASVMGRRVFDRPTRGL